ncbi:GNAT family N-acetyltransferase [Oenococcus alcoholitolerans]|uniref:GNAT family N-acetyltransferase n=1 Tax=Oenococcus alcoholitolerans TaxID=931074 RepID=UPI003F6E7AE2
MPAIFLRKSTKEDLPEIKKIFDSARATLKSQDIDQWQNSYPNESHLVNDIDSDSAYILVYDQKIAATGSITYGEDQEYTQIKGQWQNGQNKDYAAIHRTAMSDEFRGKNLSKFLISNLITTAVDKGYRDIRIDTHPDNKAMQHVIESNGFKYSGDVWIIESGIRTKRFAYQLLA